MAINDMKLIPKLSPRYGYHPLATQRHCAIPRLFSISRDRHRPTNIYARELEPNQRPGRFSTMYAFKRSVANLPWAIAPPIASCARPMRAVRTAGSWIWLSRYWL